MRNKLQRIFCPTPEEELEDLNKARALEERAYAEEWCCCCVSYIPVPVDLPDVCTAFPECKRGGLATKKCLFYEADKKRHEEEMARYRELEEIIRIRRDEAANRRKRLIE